MTSRPTHKSLVAAVSAAFVALLMAACAPEAPPTTEPEPVWEPRIEVSQTEDLEAGQTITVTGTGFNPEAHVGTRPPLSGQPSGVYVAIGRYAQTWQPSQGAAASTRDNVGSFWAVPAAQYPLVSGTAGAWILAEDGSFTVEFTVAEDTTIGAGTEDFQYGVVTYAGGGALNADQELFVPISFAEPAAS